MSAMAKNKGVFGLILPWDHNQPSAEKETAIRIERAASDCGYLCVFTDSFGYILDECYQSTLTRIDEAYEVDFVIHFHFVTAKWIDCHNFFTLWNPVGFLFAWVRAKGWQYLMDNYVSYDDYLSSTGTLANDHLKMLLEPTKNRYEDPIYLYPSVPTSSVLEVTELKDPTLFYCGMAWEKSAGAPFRHDRIFKALDRAGMLKIFGPKVANGIEVWEGFQSYSGNIPFDGKSILQEINQCGIALAFSSLEHQKNGIMSNRLFESVAAGAVVITDNNAFVNENFGDTVLKIDNFGDQEETLEQIIAHYHWILDNKEKAIEMAAGARDIFIKRFTLDTHIKNIFDTLDERKVALASRIAAKNNAEPIDVVLRWDDAACDGYLELLDYVNAQTYEAIRLLVVCDEKIAEPLQKLTEGNLKSDIEAVFVPMRIFNKNTMRGAPGHRIMTTGQMLVNVKKHLTSDCVAFIKKNEIWYSEHLTTLKRVMEDEGAELEVAYSCAASHIIDLFSPPKFERSYFGKYTIARLMQVHRQDSDSQLLVRLRFLEQLTSPMLAYIDYTEFSLILLLALKERASKFSHRMSCLRRVYSQLPQNQDLYPLVGYDEQRNYILSMIRPRLDSVYDIPMPALGPHVRETAQMVRDKRRRAEAVLFYEANERLSDARVIVYGGGEFGIIYVEEAHRFAVDIVAIADGNPALKGKDFRGISYISPDEIIGYEPDYILIASHAYKDEIQETIETLYSEAGQEPPEFGVISQNVE